MPNAGLDEDGQKTVIVDGVKIIEFMERRSRGLGPQEGKDVRSEIERLIHCSFVAAHGGHNVSSEIKLLTEVFDALGQGHREATGVAMNAEAQLVCAIDVILLYEEGGKSVLAKAKKTADSLLARQWAAMFGEGEIPNRWKTRSLETTCRELFGGLRMLVTYGDEDLYNDNIGLYSRFVGKDMKSVRETQENIAGDNRMIFQRIAEKEEEVRKMKLEADRLSKSGKTIAAWARSVIEKNTADGIAIAAENEAAENEADRESSEETEVEMIDNISRFVRTDFGGQEPRALIEKQMRAAGVEPDQATVDFVISKMKQTAEGIRARTKPRLKRLREKAIRKAQSLAVCP